MSTPENSTPPDDEPGDEIKTDEDKTPPPAACPAPFDMFRARTEDLPGED